MGSGDAEGLDKDRYKVAKVRERMSAGVQLAYPQLNRLNHTSDLPFPHTVLFFFFHILSNPFLAMDMVERERERI